MPKSALVTPLVYKLKDCQRVLEILADSPKREIRRFNKFMESNIQSASVFRRVMSQQELDKERAGETIVRLLKLSRRLTRRGWRDDNFLRCSLRVINADSIDDFEKLDKDVQHQVWTIYYSASTYNALQGCADKAFLRLLHLSGLSVEKIDKVQSKLSDDSDSPLSFQRALELKHEIDLSNPTPAFTQMLMIQPSDSHQQSSSLLKFYSRVKSYEPYGVQITLMLRALYGEERVIDLFQHFEKSNQFLCPTEMIDLLEDWESLRDYSGDWISQMKDLEHVYA